MEHVRGKYRDENGKKGLLEDLSIEDALATDKDREILYNLEDGEVSPLVNLADGDKAKMQRVGNGIYLHRCKDTLMIPTYLLGEKLSNEKMESLFQGNAIIINDGKENYYLQVDKETNSIIVRSEKEIGLGTPMVIGENKKFDYPGIELSDRDKVLMINGARTEQKLMCGDEGFFLAELGLTEDRKGFVFSNVISLSPEEAKAYMKAMENQQSMNKTTEYIPCVEEAVKERDTVQEKVNEERAAAQAQAAEKTTVHEAVVEQPVMGENTVKKEEFKEEHKEAVGAGMAMGAAAAAAGAAAMDATTEAKSDVKNSAELDSKFIEAVQNKDWKTLNDMKQEGYVPSDKALESVEKMKADGVVTEQDVNAVHRLFNLDKKKEQQAKMGVEQQKDEKGKYTGSIKQAVNSMFQSM